MQYTEEADSKGVRAESEGRRNYGFSCAGAFIWKDSGETEFAALDSAVCGFEDRKE
jgi:hypothetical protein